MTSWSRFNSTLSTGTHLTDYAVYQGLTDRRSVKAQSYGYNRANMPLSPGNKIGPFEIVSPLGAGGMGEVYRAHDTRLGGVRAIIR
jgi:serine/threonine protein kinase